MRAVVTGAGGFIGGHLVRELLRRDWEVTALLRPGSSLPAGMEGKVPISRNELSAGVSPEVLSDVDVLFHCAAQVRPTRDRTLYEKNNVVATRQMLVACAHAGVGRVVHFSSVAVHGEHTDHYDADEEAPFASPCPNHYVASKIGAEQAVVEAQSRLGLEVTRLRPGWVWGPGDRSILRLGAQIKRGILPLAGRGDNILHLAYVSNVVQAAILAATSPRAQGEAFLIHDDNRLTSRGFIRNLALAMGRSVRFVPLPRLLYLGAAKASWFFGADRFGTPYQAAIMARQQGFLITKARELLGFEPETSLQSGLAQAATWLRNELDMASS